MRGGTSSCLGAFCRWPSNHRPRTASVRAMLTCSPYFPRFAKSLCFGRSQAFVNSLDGTRRAALSFPAAAATQRPVESEVEGPSALHIERPIVAPLPLTAPRRSRPPCGGLVLDEAGIGREDLRATLRLVRRHFYAGEKPGSPAGCGIPPGHRHGLRVTGRTEGGTRCTPRRHGCRGRGFHSSPARCQSPCVRVTQRSGGSSRLCGPSAAWAACAPWPTPPFPRWPYRPPCGPRRPFAGRRCTADGGAITVCSLVGHPRQLAAAGAFHRSGMVGQPRTASVPRGCQPCPGRRQNDGDPPAHPSSPEGAVSSAVSEPGLPRGGCRWSTGGLAGNFGMRFKLPAVVTLTPPQDIGPVSNATPAARSAWSLVATPHAKLNEIKTAHSWAT